MRVDVHLIVDNKNHQHNSLYLSLTENQPFVIGRIRDILNLNDETISNHHCQLMLKKNEIFLQDFGSSNGTKINGENISFSALKENDVIELGLTKITIQKILLGGFQSIQENFEPTKIISPNTLPNSPPNSLPSFPKIPEDPNATRTMIEVSENDLPTGEIRPKIETKENPHQNFKTFFKDLIKDWKDALLNPASFFSENLKTISVKTSLMRASLLIALTVLISAFFHINMMSFLMILIAPIIAVLFIYLFSYCLNFIIPFLEGESNLQKCIILLSSSIFISTPVSLLSLISLNAHILQSLALLWTFFGVITIFQTNKQRTWILASVLVLFYIFSVFKSTNSLKQNDDVMKQLQELQNSLNTH